MTGVQTCALPISFKNRQGKDQDLVAAVGDTQIGKNLAGSPIAQGAGAVGRTAVAGAAAIPAAFMDVANKGANVVNWALGGDPNYFRTDNTQQVLQAANPSPAAAPVIAGVAKPAGQMVPSHIQSQQVAAAPVAGTAVAPAVASTAPVLAGGVKRFEFNKAAPAGGVVANNSASDWSQGSARAIAGGVDRYGRDYDGQVAHAKQVTGDTMRQLATEMTPREKAALATMNNRSMGSFMRSNAAADVEGFKARRDAFLGKEKNEQALQIAGMKEQGDKYKVDQDLAGKKYAADATVKAQEIAGVAATSKAAIAAGEKKKEAQQKDYADRVKSMVGEWSKLNLPKEYVPKLNQFAKIYAAAEDPESNVFMMAPNRENGMYAALPKQYEAAYTRLLQTMPHKDAAARIYQIAQKQGHAVDVPDFKRFLPTSEAIKQQQNTVIAGAK